MLSPPLRHRPVQQFLAETHLVNPLVWHAIDRRTPLRKVENEDLFLPSLAFVPILKYKCDN